MRGIKNFNSPTLPMIGPMLWKYSLKANQSEVSKSSQFGGNENEGKIIKLKRKIRSRNSQHSSIPSENEEHQTSFPQLNKY